jgi:hypothetical protein
VACDMRQFVQDLTAKRDALDHLLEHLRALEPAAFEPSVEPSALRLTEPPPTGRPMKKAPGNGRPVQVAPPRKEQAKGRRPRLKDAAVLDLVASSTGVTQAEVGAAFGRSGPSVQHKLDRLVASGALVRGGDKKFRRAVTPVQA